MKCLRQAKGVTPFAIQYSLRYAKRTASFAARVHVMLMPDETWVKFFGVQIACTDIAVKIGRNYPSASQDNFDCAGQSAPIKIGSLISPAIDRSAFNRHFFIGIAEAAKGVLNWLSVKPGKFSTNYIKRVWGDWSCESLFIIPGSIFPRLGGWGGSGRRIARLPSK